MHVFRVQNVLSLPLHWAYMEAWEVQTRVEMDEDGMEYGEEVLVDYRNPGFQVWDYFSTLAPCLFGVDCDGHYSFLEFRQLLVIETRRTVDTQTAWSGVLPEDVLSVKAISTKSVVEELLDRYPRLFPMDWREMDPTKPWAWFDDSVTLGDAVQADEDWWNQWLSSNARQIPIRFKETMPEPGGELAELPIVKERDL